MTAELLSHIWDVVVLFLMIFILFSWLMVLFSVIGDLFRDRELSGVAKAVWLIFLVFIPILTTLVYLIVRGRGMTERANAQMARSKEATDEYIRQVANSPAHEIAEAKALLDTGVISQTEFEALKARALA